MKGTPFQKLLLVMMLVAIAVALLLQAINTRFKPQPMAETPAIKSAQSETKSAYSAPRPKTVQAVAEEDEVDGPDQPKIPRDKAEAWLAKHHRNAASLLTVFRAMGDTNYLHEAATNFPNDPQVQLAVLSRNAFPEDRRKWLDSLQASSPDNSLADYLSAADHFRNGKSDEALQELLSASGKEQFQNYAMETLLNGEELYADAGIASREAASYAMAGMSKESLPQLMECKIAAQGIGEAMKNDPATVAELAQVGLDFAGKINSGDSGKFLINQLVGMSVERIILSQLGQNSAYDFLNGQTPAQAAEMLKQQKAGWQKLAADFGPAQLQMMQSESETASYMQRMKIYGEVAAIKWVIQQHPPTDSAK